MKKKLLLLLTLFNLKINPSEISAPNSSLPPADFVTTTQTLEKRKAELLKKIKKTDQSIQLYRPTTMPICTGGTAADGLLLLIAIAEIGGHIESAKLRKEQVKNKKELKEIEQSLADLYFKELDPIEKKKVLVLKLEANQRAKEKVSHNPSALSKIAQTHSFYKNIVGLHVATLVGSLVWGICTPSERISLYLMIGSLLTSIYPGIKCKSARDATEKLEKIKKLETKHSLLEGELKRIEDLPTPTYSSEQKKLRTKNLAVIPSNKIFKKIYNKAHFQCLDTPGKKEKLLSRLEALTQETNTLSQEASPLEKIVEKKLQQKRHSKLADIHFVGTIGLFFAGASLKIIKPNSIGALATVAYILGASLYSIKCDIEASLIQETDSKLKKIKRKLASLEGKRAKYVASLAALQT